MSTFDDDWDNWQIGDLIVWPEDMHGKSWPIERIENGYVWWRDDVHGDQMTRDTNLLRKQVSLSEQGEGEPGILNVKESRL